jgi:hypothetical protein
MDLDIIPLTHQVSFPVSLAAEAETLIETNRFICVQKSEDGDRGQ